MWPFIRNPRKQQIRDIEKRLDKINIEMRDMTKDNWRVMFSKRYTDLLCEKSKLTFEYCSLHPEYDYYY